MMNDYWYILRAALICAVIGLSFYVVYLMGSEAVHWWKPQFEAQGELIIGALWLALALYYVNYAGAAFSD